MELVHLYFRENHYSFLFLISVKRRVTFDTLFPYINDVTSKFTHVRMIDRQTLRSIWQAKLRGTTWCHRSTMLCVHQKGEKERKRKKKDRENSASWRFARAIVINVRSRSSVSALKDAPLRGSVILRGVNHDRIAARSFSFSSTLCVGERGCLLQNDARTAYPFSPFFQ